jgi:predicted enzyme related to lactoylglutathione lyase
MKATDQSVTRRDALSWMAFPFATALTLGFTPGRAGAAGVGDSARDGRADGNHPVAHQGATTEVYYLEIVATDADATCALYSQMYGMAFGDADPSLGGARTARLANGRLLGVRMPMNEDERPVTRPYILVEDIEAAVAAAESAGAEITVPPMSIPGHGTFAIIYQSGIESGLWQGARAPATGAEVR